MSNTRSGAGAFQRFVANQALGTEEFAAIDPNGVCVTFQEWRGTDRFCLLGPAEVTGKV
jgi:hypothetical protein